MACGDWCISRQEEASKHNPACEACSLLQGCVLAILTFTAHTEVSFCAGHFNAWPPYKKHQMKFSLLQTAVFFLSAGNRLKYSHCLLCVGEFVDCVFVHNKNNREHTAMKEDTVKYVKEIPSFHYLTHWWCWMGLLRPVPAHRGKAGNHTEHTQFSSELSFRDKLSSSYLN